MNRRFLSSRAELLLLVLAVTACQDAAREARIWRASDHDRGDSPAQAPASNPSEAAIPAGSGDLPAQQASPHGAGAELDASVMRVWASQCVVCHGQIGAGDGPNGPATGARNLSEPSWQSAVSDERITESIRRGRGQMPGFAALSPEVLGGLVRLIRQMSAQPIPHAASPGPAPAPPAR